MDLNNEIISILDLLLGEMRQHCWSREDGPSSLPLLCNTADEA